MGNVDKESYIPYYVQIKEDLLERIRDGAYRSGQRIPSEQALAEEYQVTRTTVRKALDELKREGVIRTEKGKGSVVSNSRIEQSLLQFYSFGREIGTTGEAAASRVIKVGQVPASPQLEKKLRLPPNGAVHEIVRLRHYRNTPLILEFSYVPTGVAPSITEQDLESQSIYDLLERVYGWRVQGAKEYLYPRISDTYESELLQIPRHSPVFQTERITRGEDGRVIEFRRSVIRGDKVTFSTELT